uniref:DUF5723 domain-containing protein n=1 Tax=candidate division WOR-3 bacterium TaxID=2052148 RepID=A0A7C4YBV9_UNCW3
MIILLIYQTAFYTGSGGAISGMVGLPENIFFNPASIGNEEISITFSNPFGVEDFYRGEIYFVHNIRDFISGFGIRIKKVYSYYENDLMFSLKYGIIGFSFGGKYKVSEYGTRFYYNIRYGALLSYKGLNIGISNERKSISYKNINGIISFETTNFNDLHFGLCIIPNNVFYGVFGFDNRFPSFGIGIKTGSLSLEFGLRFTELGMDNVWTTRWGF